MTPRVFLFAIVMAIGVAGCAGSAVRPAEESDTAQQQQKIRENTTVSASQMMDGARVREASAEYHFAMAQAYVADSNPDRAIEEYKTALAFDQKSALIHVRLAAEYVKKGMLSEAMESCKEAVRLDPKFIDARLMLAGLYSTARETDSALAEYDTVLSFDPANDEAIVYKSQVLIEDNRASEATTALRKFVKRAPNSILGWYYLGRAEQQQDHFKEAVLAYRKALEINENFTQASLALGFAYETRGNQLKVEAETKKADGHSGSELEAEATVMSKKAIEIYKGLFDATQDGTAANRISTILLKEGKYQEALPYLESIARTDSEDMNVRVKLGLIQMELKEYAAAEQTFKQILAKNPESDRVRFYLGNMYEETKRFEPAIEQFKSVFVESRFYEESVLHAAFLLKQVGRPDEAKKHVATAITASPKVPSFYLFQASLEDESKNVPRAIALLETAVESFPDHERIRYYLGSLYDRVGNLEKSLYHMEAILKDHPENVDALNYVGYTWTSQGIRLDDAEQLLRKAISLSPDNGYVRDSWGWYLFTRGRISEAVVHLEKAVHLKPDEAVILEHLADAYLKMNLREKAMRTYKDAVAVADPMSRRKIQDKIETLKSEFAQSERSRDNRAPASQTSKESLAPQE